jgi:hypothetical protein
MATANRTWGEERIADELLVKLGVRVSPRTEGPPLNKYNVESGRDRLPDDDRVAATPILGGLHREYRLETAA